MKGGESVAGSGAFPCLGAEDRQLGEDARALLTRTGNGDAPHIHSQSNQSMACLRGICTEVVNPAGVVATRDGCDDDGVLEEALVLDGFEAARGEVLASVARVLDACNFCQRDFIYLDLSDQA